MLAVHLSDPFSHSKVAACRARLPACIPSCLLHCHVRCDDDGANIRISKVEAGSQVTQCFPVLLSGVDRTPPLAGSSRLDQAGGQ